MIDPWWLQKPGTASGHRFTDRVPPYPGLAPRGHPRLMGDNASVIPRISATVSSGGASPQVRRLPPGPFVYYALAACRASGFGEVDKRTASI